MASQGASPLAPAESDDTAATALTKWSVLALSRSLAALPLHDDADEHRKRTEVRQARAPHPPAVSPSARCAQARGRFPSRVGPLTWSPWSPRTAARSVAQVRTRNPLKSHAARTCHLGRGSSSRPRHLRRLRSRYDEIRCDDARRPQCCGRFCWERRGDSGPRPNPPLRRLQELQPEARLALAVLEDVAETLRTTHATAPAPARVLASQAWSWVVSDDALYPFAFRVTCQHLELDADWLRNGLARWRPVTPSTTIRKESSRRKSRRAA